MCFISGQTLSKPKSVRFMALLLKGNEVTVIIMHFPDSSEEAKQSNHDLRTTILSFLPPWVPAFAGMTVKQLVLRKSLWFGL